MTAHATQKLVEIKPTLRSVDDLQQAGLITAEMAKDIAPLSQRYTIAVTPEMAEIIESVDDVIGKQFIPDTREMLLLPQENSDPIGDYAHAPTKALVHRHKNRVLLKPTMACAVYCRFCFRREMVGPQGDTITQEDVDQALDYIAEHSEITEVILTGGDPLMLSPERLGKLLNRLQAIPHLRWIRLHTRMPVVAPKKITMEMVQALKGIKPVYMAIHTNHRRELTVEAGAALSRLAQSGVVLLGQTVLLKGINDSVDALRDLFETMLMHRIKPYYLHHPDLTAGTSHFRLSLDQGMALMEALRAEEVSGLSLPAYILDIPGGVSKIPVTQEYVQKTAENSYILRDPSGASHVYHDILG